MANKPVHIEVGARDALLGRALPAAQPSTPRAEAMSTTSATCSGPPPASSSPRRRAAADAAVRFGTRSFL
jgi:hypothetical protein